MPAELACIGAGFSGAVIARELAEQGFNIDVYDSRNHIAGNCYTARDEKTGIQLHQYGPHIFHTDNAEVWHYVNRFAVFEPYTHRVKAVSHGRVYTLPVNLHTMNQLTQKVMSPAQAQQWISQQSANIAAPANFDEQARTLVGDQLYQAFFAGYTQKQWGCSPMELPASIFKRLPVRFNYDDNYFFHKYQGLPRDGYTQIVANILDHPNIHLNLNTRFERAQVKDYSRVFYSGPIDQFFNYEWGRLDYRTLDFEKIFTDGDYQGCAVMNYCDLDVPFTRITEHKYFTPWEQHEDSVCYREFSRAAQPDDIPYYPIRLAKQQEVLKKYVAEAAELSGVTFVGRLGTYRYLDMDLSIAEALKCARDYIEAKRKNTSLPAFVIDPL